LDDALTGLERLDLLAQALNLLGALSRRWRREAEDERAEQR
jgi:hypothetical protein